MAPLASGDSVIFEPADLISNRIRSTHEHILPNQTMVDPARSPSISPPSGLPAMRYAMVPFVRGFLACILAQKMFAL